MKTIQLTILTFTILVAISAPSEAAAQIAGAQPSVIKHAPGLLPKLALKGAVGETKDGIHYHKITLAITNWEKYNPDMFTLPTGKTLPPDHCRDTTSRVIAVVYSERGTVLSGCIQIAKPAHLGSFAFLMRKGTSVHQFIYAVINDQYTGAVYRSNLVSPWSGATK